MEQSNPIQQRIELLAERWIKTSANKKIKLVKILYKPDEEDMIDTFFTYMHGLNSPIDDITFQFDDIFINKDDYSKQLLDTLKLNLQIWNECQKVDNVEFEPVHWQPDDNKTNKSNPAWLFIANFNDLTRSLDLEPDYATVVIWAPSVIGNVNGFARWVENALEANIDGQVKLLVADNQEKPVFSNLEGHPLVETLVANLDMPNAMQQIAAMGDPNEPSTPYRQSFLKMMQAMNDKKDDGVYAEGNKCIAIAIEHVNKDSYWLTQLIVIYTAWGNYEMGKKNYKEAKLHANKTVEVARELAPLLGDDKLGNKYIAQTMMQRGIVYYACKEWDNALPDYAEAARLYAEGDEYILGTEAYRMTASVAVKAGDKDAALEALVKGIKLGQNIPPAYIHGTTYAALFEQILKFQFEKIISFNELESIAIPIYGENWIDVVRHWKDIPEQA